MPEAIQTPEREVIAPASAGRREVLSVLAVTSELPWPLDTGGHLRSFHLMRALAQRFRLRLVVPCRRGEEGAVEALRQAGVDVRPGWVGPRVKWREAVQALGAAVRGEPYVLYRRHNHAAVRAVLREELRTEAPDVAYLDHLDSLLYWNELPPGTPCVIDQHNVYSTLVLRAADERRGPARWYLRREARLLDKMERRAALLPRSAMLAVSDLDARHFSNLGAQSVHVVPNGVDCSAYASLPTGRCHQPPVLLYVGAMSWAPNVSAAQFLATDVLPKVRERFPDACLRIVGRDPSAEALALRRLPGVEVTGTVPSMLPHLAEASVLCVPLEAGGGTRLKILEAFAAGLPVVSTPVGCEGIEAAAGEHLVIAPRERFAEAVTNLLKDARVDERLAAAARAKAKERYDWGAVSQIGCEAVERMGSRSALVIS